MALGGAKRAGGAREAAAKFGPDDIVGAVRCIQAADGTPEERRARFRSVYPEFAERYPGIFFRASESGMDLGMLQMMVANLREPDGEERVGQALFDRFVSPAFRRRMRIADHFDSAPGKAD